MDSYHENGNYGSQNHYQYNSTGAGFQYNNLPQLSATGQEVNPQSQLSSQLHVHGMQNPPPIHTYTNLQTQNQQLASQTASQNYPFIPHNSLELQKSSKKSLSSQNPSTKRSAPYNTQKLPPKPTIPTNKSLVPILINDPKISPKKQYSCPECFKVFANKHTCLIHMKMVHEGIKNFVCPIQTCAKGFATKQQLERHHKKHHEDPSIQEQLHCHFCTRTYGSIYGLNKHIETQHAHEHLEEFGPDKFECDTCGKKFDTVQHLEIHTKWHASVKGVGPKGNGKDLSCTVRSK